MADEADLLLSSALDEALDSSSPDGAVPDPRGRSSDPPSGEETLLQPAPAPPRLPEGLPSRNAPITADLPHEGVVDVEGEVAPPPPPSASGMGGGGVAGQAQGVGHHQATDSITLGQLRGLVHNVPKSRPSVYSYEHKDSAPTREELEEFFSYTEIPGLVLEGREAWERGWYAYASTDWPEAPTHQRKDFLYTVVEQLETRDAGQRFEAARRLAYVAQGTPMYTSSPEEQLQAVLHNCMLLRSVGALQVVYDALRTAGGRWTIVSDSLMMDETMANAPPSPDWPSMEERQEYLEEINAEMSIYLSILYFMAEIFRGDQDWAEELMTLAPPLPIYLFGLVAGLREKNAKGYPVKKLLLLLWKSLLACFGGQNDISRVKRFVRDIEGLSNDDKKPRRRFNTKVQPTDFKNFQSEVMSKYPTYVPPPVDVPIPDISLDQVAAAAVPQPLRPLFPHHQQHPSDPNHPHQDGQEQQQQQQQQQFQQPATPAPSPPPSPQAKPKKQQFQTDQTRPFVMPYTSRNIALGPHGEPMMVPRAIAEAGDLYAQHVRISTELWQTVKLREEMVADESGTSQADADLVQNSNLGAGASAPIEDRLAGLKLSQRSSVVDDDDDDDLQDLMDPLEMLHSLEQDLRRKAKGKGRAGQEKVEDVRRLQRIEVFYRLTLPDMQSAVIVLLKLLLATVTPNSSLNGMPPGMTENDPPPQLSLEETDILRHREITSKSVSAVLLLLLRWLKTSHAMKFQYLAQLLVDSNCLLLILKIFGLHEVSTQVKYRHEHEPANFFRYCAEHGSRHPRPEEQLPRYPKSPSPIPSTTSSDGEVELIHEYSARNFFSVINFVHILQKLTKRKLHRVLLLVQYKSSAILKRLLKVSHPLLQLYTLKVIKSQIPYCGRKWRQSNMKVITSIYLHCRPDLRDEWLVGADIDGDVEDSLPNEQALRALVKFFNQKHYLPYASLQHRRSSSQIAQQNINQQGADPSQPPTSPNDMPMDESFPPARSMAMFGHAPAFRLSYIPDSLAESFMGDEYEAILGDLLTPRYTIDHNGIPSLFPDGSGAQAETAWSRLGEILGETESISDSESVGNMDALQFIEPEPDTTEPVPGETRAGWSEMSPEIIMALEEERDSSAHLSPRSPRPRRSSTEPKSPALRPVLASIENETEESAVQKDEAPEEERGPIPSEAHSGPAVDEVEAVFGE